MLSWKLKKGIIIDLNDTDDYYAFTSKQIRDALQKYALNDTENINRIPQIVLEYHRKSFTSLFKSKRYQLISTLNS